MILLVIFRGLTSVWICVRFYLLKAVMKTRDPRRIPREDAILVQGICNTVWIDTTSEPPGRNARMGAPITASMSGSVRRATRVEPWNTLYPTPDFQGVGIFIPSPQ